MNKFSKIIVYYPSFERGGVTKVLQNFLNECIKKKIDVLLITEGLNWKKNYNISKKVKIVHTKKLNMIFFSKRIVSSILSINTMISLFSKINKKKTIFFSFQSNIIPIILCNLFGIKIVIRNSEDIIAATKHADKKLFAFLVFFLKIIFYNFADGVIANSTKSKKSLERIIYKRDKVKLIFNPYLNKSKNNKFHKKQKIILSIGRLCKQKNFQTLIKAFKIFSLRNKDYKLIILGHGPDKQKLISLCENLGIDKKVIFKNWVVDTNVYLKRAKLFVLPSLYEGLPNSLIDAVNSEVPSISTRCSGAEDILFYKNGIYFNYKNYEDLAKKLKMMNYNYKESLNRIIKSKSKIYRFYIEKQVEKYINYLNKIMTNL